VANNRPFDGSFSRDSNALWHQSGQGMPEQRWPPLISSQRRDHMLGYAIGFLIVAIIAGILGFGVIAGTAALIAKILFVIFLILFIVSLFRRRRI
jgi:uncharacterized membrane protein YtjA (UPF0391 family)